MTRGRPDFTDRVVVVTGGTRGIGRAVVEALAEAGADVVPTARTADDVEAAAAAVRDLGRESLAVPTDVADADAVAALFGAVDDAFGRVDLLVNDAGINPPAGMGRPSAVDLDAFEATLDVNLRGAFTCARAAADLLHADGGGAVVNVASVSGLVGTPRQHHYTASKHGLVGLTKSLALDWAPDVRVNAVAPGYVSTALTEPLQANETLYESILDRTPMGRFADPGEVADAVLFLGSDRASFVTGGTLVVDGGWTAR